ncbi:MAG: sugar phosphate nucleotidyltransferase [bacterium]
MLLAVLLTGGVGTRLRPLTYQMPKPLLPLMNRPFILYVLEYLARHKITDVVLTLSHKGEEIMEYFQQNPFPGATVRFSMEKFPMGTAGALKNVEPYIEGDSILVMNGDILTDFPIHSLIEAHKKKGAKVTIALKEVEDPSAFGLALLGKGERIKKFVEKPSEFEWVEDRTINAGIYVIDVDLLEKIPVGQEVSLERAFFPALIANDIPVYGKVFDGYWLDVGTFSSYFKAHQDILAGKIRVSLPGKMRKNEGVWMQDRVRIAESAEVKPPVFIGENTVIGEGAVITEYTVIGSRCTIQKEARVESAILHEEVLVGENARIRESLLGRGVIIEPGAHIRSGNILGSGSVISQGSILPSSF